MTAWARVAAGACLAWLAAGTWLPAEAHPAANAATAVIATTGASREYAVTPI
jgi:hypothetical protein